MTDQGPKHAYRVRRRVIKGWRIATRQPRILLAQIRTALEFGAFDDRRIRVKQSPQYHDLLISVLQFSKEADAHFVVFPECAWPIDWAIDVLQWLNDEGRGHTAYVLPFEHLSFEEYDRLMRILCVEDSLRRAELSDVAANAPGVETDDVFVNPLVTLIRTSRGVQAIPQRKLRPARLEGTAHTGRWRFAGGTETRKLEGNALHGKVTFATMICFDTIAYDQRYSDEPFEIVLDSQPNYIFIPECNPDPLHAAYARSTIRLTGGGQVPPLVCFCNVADGSDIPISNARLGLTRIIGELGVVAPDRPLSAVVVDGILTDDEPQSLADIAGTTRVFHDRDIRSLYVRREQTLTLLQPPPVGEHPSKNPTFGSANTTVELYHHLGEHGWHRFLDIGAPPKPETRLGIPTGYLVRWNLYGVEAARSRLRELLDDITPILWVTGEGGGGKTAVVAHVLKDTAGEQRVVWVDLGQIQHHSDALVEELLTALGRTDALTESHEHRLDVIRQVGGERSTTFVLDSADRWRENSVALPDWLPEITGWSRRFIITSRYDPVDPAVPNIPISKLSRANALALISEVAEGIAPPSYSEALARATGNLPLGCVWAGELYRTAPDYALALARKISDEENPLVSLFNACVDGLKPTARDALGVLCSLPAPLTEWDIADILGVSEEAARVSGHVLRDRNLAMYFDPAGNMPRMLHFRHPFVRQFWTAANVGMSYDDQLLSWAERLLAEHGGERNWRGIEPLDLRWKNVGYLLRTKLANASNDAQKGRFLHFWRMVDTFLWTSKKWRERLELGETALRFSIDLNDKRSEGHARYESLAQPKWHMHSNRAEAEPLIDRAIEIFRELGENVQLARAMWYRSRMLRACGYANEALEASKEALGIAEAIVSLSPDEERARTHAIALAHHGIGNALGSLEHGAEALAEYQIARPLFEATHDPEMVAVIDRRIGIVHLEASRFGSAAKELKASVEAFRKMRISLEEAESINFHARALAALGEIDAARAEHAYAEHVLRPLGSDARNRELEETRNYIEGSALR